ncbi:hypothetical protein AGDE_15681 [Angomonas deanei]|nr:hypothetical protein AGDE_15681 [Angomonas deanei]|eukprot:EPY18677.1 hypothetical protein AGDE_15681 [Angomonas deanei]
MVSVRPAITHWYLPPTANRAYRRRRRPLPSVTRIARRATMVSVRPATTRTCFRPPKRVSFLLPTVPPTVRHATITCVPSAKTLI